MSLKILKIVVASHGKECLDILTENSPEKIDFILMDMEMLALAGLQCAQDIIRMEPEG